VLVTSADTLITGTTASGPMIGVRIGGRRRPAPYPLTPPMTEAKNATIATVAYCQISGALFLRTQRFDQDWSRPNDCYRATRRNWDLHIGLSVGPFKAATLSAWPLLTWTTPETRTLAAPPSFGVPSSNFRF
jgi:hypothetical protein